MPFLRLACLAIESAEKTLLKAGADGGLMCKNRLQHANRMALAQERDSLGQAFDRMRVAPTVRIDHVLRSDLFAVTQLDGGHVTVIGMDCDDRDSLQATESAGMAGVLGENAIPDLALQFVHVERESRLEVRCQRTLRRSKLLLADGKSVLGRGRFAPGRLAKAFAAAAILSEISTSLSGTCIHAKRAGELRPGEIPLPIVSGIERRKRSRHAGPRAGNPNHFAA